MANFNVHVDTGPLAAGVDRVKNRVDGTTAAVVEMQQATILAEKEAALELSRKVDDGFRTLIISQISQKSALARAEMDSKLQELLQLSDFLNRLQGQMERDFQRIRQRYTILFRALDASTTLRIAELDRAAFELGNRSYPRITQRELATSGVTLIHQFETQATIQSVSVAKTRQTTLRAIQAMATLVTGGSNLSMLLNSVVHDVKVEKRQLIAVPVVFIESDSPDGHGKIRRVFECEDLRLSDQLHKQLERAMTDSPGVEANSDEYERVLKIAGERLENLAETSRVKVEVRNLLRKQYWDSVRGTS